MTVEEYLILEEIREHMQRHSLAVCGYVCDEAVNRIPRFRLVSGTFKGCIGHVWLKDGDTIIDPTANQFGLPTPLILTSEDKRYGWYNECQLTEDDAFLLYTEGAPLIINHPKTGRFINYHSYQHEWWMQNVPDEAYVLNAEDTGSEGLYAKGENNR